jgi:membrane-associated phospholipid phosphatase
MAVRTDNLNLNLNLNLGGSAGGGGITGYGRPRFNTEDMDKLLPATLNVNVPHKQYSPDWDPELRAWAYVAEFITAPNWGGTTPVAWLANLVTNNNGPGSTGLPPFNPFPVPDLDPLNPINPTHKLDNNGMATQVQGVVDQALDRADKYMEILDQAPGGGALNYWTGLLRIDPSQEKNAYLLMVVARKIGEYAAMGLKNVYRMRRPSQVYSLILPLIDPPDTPSFPSSHSLQAHLISFTLMDALANQMAPKNFSSPISPGQWAAQLDPKMFQAYPTAGALLTLADRVAINREVAGVHYQMDSACGAFAAFYCWQQLKSLPATSLYKTLVAAATAELSDLP